MGGEPAAIYNNCSGKHAGMLALAVLEGAGIETYMHPEHPAQRCITARVAAACGLSPDAAHTGTDGCSAPTLYAPLVAMARGFARLAREAAEPASAAARIGAAMARCPEMLGEEDDFQAVFSRELGQRAIGKYGAEGLYCVAVPERELGIAVRIEDGAQRAVAPVVLEILLELGIFDRQELGALSRFHEMTLTNWRGTEIGIMRSSVVLSREHDVETRDVERSARAARS
jgi:L-asparaginase II